MLETRKKLNPDTRIRALTTKSISSTQKPNQISEKPLIRSITENSTVLDRNFQPFSERRRSILARQINLQIKKSKFSCFPSLSFAS